MTLQLPIERRAPRASQQPALPVEVLPEVGMRLIVKNTFFDVETEPPMVAEEHESGARTCSARFATHPSPQFGLFKGTEDSPHAPSEATSFVEHRSSSCDDDWDERMRCCAALQQEASSSARRAPPGAVEPASGSSFDGRVARRSAGTVHARPPAPPVYPAPRLAKVYAPPPRTPPVFGSGVPQLMPPVAPPQPIVAARASLTSVGSVGHGQVTADGAPVCLPCAWVHKAAGCHHGAECRYCHECPKGELKHRKQKKAAQLRELEQSERPGRQAQVRF